ncbi:hypothetical protein [Mesorhizobium sp.]|uniref:hypothetical protein n=1 Tax=Mesorhizobium sp. TaxID=1871066 RepID=UPI0025E53B9C|nr:hypothetical protein [Mesorhizobium sp.]
MAGGELDADQAMATFARIDVSDLPGVERPVADCPDPAGSIVVAFPSGTRLRIDGIVDPTALRIVRDASLTDAGSPCVPSSPLSANSTTSPVMTIRSGSAGARWAGKPE